MRRWCVILGVLATAAGTLTARDAGPERERPQDQQDPQRPVFRTGVTTVAIYASVLDRYGELITDLEQDDFEVRDNGRVQELTTFVTTFQPITATILLDTSASMAVHFEQARAAAEQFVIRLIPGDSARIGTLATGIRYSGDLTDDRDALLESLREDLDTTNPTELWDGIDQARRDLSSVGGRRVILLMTDGSDTASRQARDTVLSNLRNDEVMVYVVQFPITRWPDIEWSILTQRYAGMPIRYMRRRTVTEGLARIATQTGGGHFILEAHDDLNATFTHVTFELHHQYLMGFTPQALDGKTHRLEVLVPSLDEDVTTIRARQHYLAAPPPTAGDNGRSR